MEKFRILYFIIVLLTIGYMLLLILCQNESRQTPFPPINDREKEMKKIVFWTSWFNDHSWKHIMEGKTTKVLKCDIKCSISIDHSDPLIYDALVFHGRDHMTAPKKRTPNQVYIIFLKESPYHRGNFIKGAKYFNWSATYSRKSEIQTPYFTITKKATGGNFNTSRFALPQMKHKRNNTDALVYQVVSNCRTPSRRREYVNLLKQYIKVDIFGGCGMGCSGKGGTCHEHLAKTGRYKFYLSFENSACKDYITEKVFNPLNLGIVPVVYGGLSAEDYEVKLPPGSYIDVRNFTSAKKLADYLSYLDNNDTAYLAYQNWRGSYEVPVRNPDWLCSVCQRLHNTSLSTPRNVNWDKFWHSSNQCDGHLIDKVK